MSTRRSMCIYVHITVSDTRYCLYIFNQYSIKSNIGKFHRKIIMCICCPHTQNHIHIRTDTYTPNAIPEKRVNAIFFLHSLNLNTSIQFCFNFPYCCILDISIQLVSIHSRFSFLFGFRRVKFIFLLNKKKTWHKPTTIQIDWKIRNKEEKTNRLIPL